MKAWARRNPVIARVLLRFALRLLVALAVVIPLLPLVERYNASPNLAAIAAVVIGLALGGRLAARVATLWQLPEETTKGDGA